MAALHKETPKNTASKTAINHLYLEFGVERFADKSLLTQQS
jgi:hypothetical protein